MGKPIRAMPGPGGSLGECGVYGDSFALAELRADALRIPRGVRVVPATRVR